MMRKCFPALLLLLVQLLTGCDRGNPAAPSEDFISPTPQSSSNRSGVISGFVWMDVNRDGIWDVMEPKLSGVQVELVKSDETLIELTDSKGQYSFNVLEDEQVYIKFTPPEDMNVDFTAKDVGTNETLDSDVSPQGKTDQYKIAGGETLDLSAGLLPEEIVVELLRQVIADAVDDCTIPGQAEQQPCEGDIHSCDVTYDPEAGHVSFVCTLIEVSDYSQFDFYVTLDTDGDPTTGKSEGQVEGVDAELYLNSLESRIQINRYDLNGNYIRGDVLDPEGVQPIFGTDDDEKIGIQIDQAQAQVRELIDQNTIVSFVLVTYPPAGGKLRDDTRSLGDDWYWGAYWKIDF